LTVLAGLPQGETTFEYLAGCWKRLNSANREANRLVRQIEIWDRLGTHDRQTLEQKDRQSWHTTADKLKGLIISYIGMTLEDPTMFPQPDK
jgi:ubiquitin conjugation factor E4 B